MIATFSKLNAQSDCSTIRLDAPGGPVHGLPIMDQDGLPICESFAAVIAVDAARFYENGNKNVSPISCPISLAVRTAARTGFPNIEGPAMEILLEKVHKFGICDYEQISRQLSENLDKDFCSDLRDFVSTIKTSPNSAASPGTNFCGLKRPNSTALDPIKVLANVTKTEANARAVQIKFDKMCEKSFIKPTNLNQHTYNHQFNKPFKLSDKPGDKSPEQMQRYDSLRGSIDEALSGNKPVPPLIRYCFNFLVNANAPSGIDPTSGNMAKCKQTDAEGNTYVGNHASAIVGRRKSKDGKSCQFLIRNSHGTSCNAYDKTWECDKTKGGLPCPAGDVCGGQIWVDEAALISNLQDVIHLKAK